VFSEERDLTDVPWLDLEAGLVRQDLGLSLYTNVVHCWPSVGGIVIAERVHAVELAYIGLDRFHTTPRSPNETEEDAFCIQLRKIGGKWWSSYDDFEMATRAKLRMVGGRIMGMSCDKETRPALCLALVGPGLD
jgi:hypothetical protein